LIVLYSIYFISYLYGFYELIQYNDNNDDTMIFLRKVKYPLNHKPFQGKGREVHTLINLTLFLLLVLLFCFVLFRGDISSCIFIIRMHPCTYVNIHDMTCMHTLRTYVHMEYNNYVCM
jgi:hypothetical protein